MGGVAHIVAIGPSMISTVPPPTGHPRAEKLEPPLIRDENNEVVAEISHMPILLSV